jgi:hypothetical protein
MRNVILSLVFSVATSNAHAFLLNIDFQPSGSIVYSGQGILGSATDTVWNAVDFGGASNLTLADGTVGSGVNIATSFDRSFSNLDYPPNLSTNTLLSDRLIGDDGTITRTITLTGLAAYTAYNVVLYNGWYAQTYSADGQSAATDPVSGISANNNYPSWTENVEYAVLRAAVSDAGGQLVIQIAPLDGLNDFNPYNSAVAGLQIQDVPLPSAFYLFGTGLLGLVGLARRKTA